LRNNNNLHSYNSTAIVVEVEKLGFGTLNNCKLEQIQETKKELEPLSIA
jgi:hypothetical protein